MSSIPEEIYLEILLRVRVKSILAFKCVCKTWFSIISNPDFVNMHLNIQRNKPSLMLRGYEHCEASGITWYRNFFYSISHDSLDSLLSRDEFQEYAELDYPFKSLGYSVDLMSSCDGLVCLRFHNNERLRLWNPATRETRVLPKSKHYVGTVAFGYDYKSSDYKLLAGSRSMFEVYSVRLNSWKSIEKQPYMFNGCNKGVLVNENFHWMADNYTIVVSLDISSNIFKEIEIPRETKGFVCQVEVLEGCLCLRRNLGYSFEIWVMQNYGVGESWNLRYNFKDQIISRNLARIMWSFKSGEILFGGNGLLVYDPKLGASREPNVSFPRSLDQELYFESLVSLKSSTQVGGEEEMEEPKKKRKNDREHKTLKKRA